MHHVSTVADLVKLSLIEDLIFAGSSAIENESYCGQPNNMSYRKNSVISWLLKTVELKFKSETGVEPVVDSIPWADWDLAWDFENRAKPKLYLYSGLGALGDFEKPDPRIVILFDEYLPEVIRFYQEGSS